MIGFLAAILIADLLMSTFTLYSFKQANYSLMQLSSTLSDLQLEVVVSIHLIHQHTTHLNMISFSRIWPDQSSPNREQSMSKYLEAVKQTADAALGISNVYDSN